MPILLELQLLELLLELIEFGISLHLIFYLKFIIALFNHILIIAIYCGETVTRASLKISKGFKVEARIPVSANGCIWLLFRVALGTQIVEQRINSECKLKCYLSPWITHYLCSQCYAAQQSYAPLLSLRRDSPSKIVPGFLCATL